MPIAVEGQIDPSNDQAITPTTLVKLAHNIRRRI
jgi:hypothetical protein